MKDPDKLYPWVFQTTRNAIVDFYREQKLKTDSADELLSEIAFETSEE